VDLIVPYYHIVTDERPLHVNGLYNYRNVSTFQADLDFWLRHYIPVGLSDVMEWLDERGSLPKRAVLLTFDDGFREMHDVVAPILHSRGMPAVFFVVSSMLGKAGLCIAQKKCLLVHALSAPRTTDATRREVLCRLRAAGMRPEDAESGLRSVPFRSRRLLDKLAAVLECDLNAYANNVQPYLTVSQVRHLENLGYDVGAHSVDHAPYQELTLAEQINQTLGSARALALAVGKTCRSFAFPHSDAGVGAGFFDAVLESGGVRVTFGTSGMLRHFCPRNIERFSMEWGSLPAAVVVKRQYCRTLLGRP
jgi:peptidoglycan/xylan/chitin deacetylase (PgdA/CDA1 family)